MSDARIVERVKAPQGRECSAVHIKTQLSAIGYVKGTAIYVQFNNVDHPQSEGWWKYPASDFEVVLWAAQP